MEADRLQEASGDKLDEEAKARRKKCAAVAPPLPFADTVLSRLNMLATPLFRTPSCTEEQSEQVGTPLAATCMLPLIRCLR